MDFWSKLLSGVPKNWNFSNLGSNTSSVAKIELNWYPTRQIWQKIGNFQGNCRVLVNSGKIPEMMEFRNSALKIKFLHKKWVGKRPHMLNLVKTRQIQGIPGFLEFWIPGSKNQKLLPKVRKNNTNMLQGLFLFFI